jgi:hypothetical protein
MLRVHGSWLLDAETGQLSSNTKVWHILFPVESPLTITAANANGYPYEIYAEPTRKLHGILNLISNIKGAPAGERKSYVPNIFSSTLASIGVGTRSHPPCHVAS